MTKNKFMAASINPEKVSEILRECAQKCILPYHGKLKEHHKSFKGGDPNNLVTVADHKSEAFLAKKLKELLPNSYIVGEESYEDDPSIINYLKDKTKNVWVIDPIDGTGNFTRGSKTFCVIIALVIDGQTRMGWIYDVCNDSLTFAEKGKGAFVDGKKLDLKQQSADGEDNSAAKQKLEGYCGYKFARQHFGASVRTLRCSGHEYLHLSQGDAAFSLYSRMKPWDHLAGTLIVEEAGGYVRKWDGSTYRPEDETGGIITARDKQTWQKVRDLIPHTVLKRHNIKP